MWPSAPGFFIVFSRLTRVATHLCQRFVLQSIVWTGDISFLYSSADGHLGYSYLCAITNSD